MNKKNTMSIPIYILFNIIFGVIYMIIYQNTIFQNIDNMTTDESKTILLIIFAISLIIGMLITIKNRRNNISVFVNIAIACEVYAVISFFKYFETLILATLCSVLFIAMIYFIKTINKKNNLDETTQEENSNKKLFGALMGCRTIIAFCLLVLVVPIGFNLIPSNLSVSGQASYSEEYTIENSKAQLSQLDEQIWSTLSTQEKLDVMQTVANIEKNYLGLPHELTIETEDLEGETLGSYWDFHYVIKIDSEHLENSMAKDVLDTICHEAYHAYQHRLVDIYNQSSPEDKDLLMFEDVKKYKEEFELNYVNGVDGFTEYYSQQCEIDAREYAQISVYDYLIKIFEEPTN